jgi:hypothetical protein
MFQTGTGPGQVIGWGRLGFHAHEDRAFRSCVVSWDGDAAWIPFLPGLAFDQYFPNLRMIQREGVVLYAKEAQQATLADFQDWVGQAREQLDAGGTLPRFETLPLADPQSGERSTERAAFAVRLNRRKERLWSETGYSSSEARDVLFSLIYQLLWDWCVSRDSSGGMTALSALERQLAYYGVHGIPSDFLMRQIGKAPYTSWKASEAARAAEPGGA